VSRFIYCYAECHHPDSHYADCQYAECRTVKYNASGRDSGYTYLGFLGITATNIRKPCLMLRRLNHQR
jgi:hypothetical protein